MPEQTAEEFLSDARPSASDFLSGVSETRSAEEFLSGPGPSLPQKVKAMLGSLITPIPELASMRTQLGEKASELLSQARPEVLKEPESTNIAQKALLSVRNTFIPLPSPDVGKAYIEMVIPASPLELAGTALSPATVLLGKLLGKVSPAAKAVGVVSEAAQEVGTVQKTLPVLDDIKRVSEVIKRADLEGVHPSMIMTDAEKAIFSAHGQAIKSANEFNVPLEAIFTEPEMSRIVIEAPRTVTGAAGGQVPKYAANINLSRLNTTDDIKLFVRDLSEANKEGIQHARRGVISLKETESLADDLGLKTEDILKRRKGEALNAETLLAYRQVNVSTASEAWRKASSLPSNPTQEQLGEVALAVQRANAVMEEVSGATAESGRALGALRIHAGEVDPSRALQAVVRASGGPEKVEEIAKNLSRIDPTDVRSVNKFLRESSKATIPEKVYEAWINLGLLSGPATHTANTLSNALVALTRGIVEKPISASLEALRALSAGAKRERFFGEGLADAIGATRGLGEGVRKGLEAFRTGISAYGDTKIDQARIEAIKGTLGSLIRAPGRALVGMDDFFKSLAESAEMHALAYRQAAKEGHRGIEAISGRMAEILSSPSSEMRGYAAAEAAYRTFTNDLGQAGKTLMSLRNQVPGLNYIIPFLRTPINIAKYGLERTPLNFLRLWNMSRSGQLAGSALVDELAKPVMGTFIGLAIADSVKDGLITGGGPRDFAKRKTLMASGWQPYSLRIGNQYVSYGRLEPLAITVGLTADFIELSQITEQEDAVSKVGLAIAQNLTSKTFLRGTAELLNAVQDPERYGASYLQRMSGTLVPSFVASAARASEPFTRRPETTLQQLQSRIPFAGRNLPLLRDIWGEPVISVETSAERFASPIRRTISIPDKATEEAVRLDIRVGTPRRTLGNVDLLPEEYESYVERSGKFAHDLVSKFVGARGYDGIPDEIKAEKVKSLVEKARSVERRIAVAKRRRNEASGQ